MFQYSILQKGSIYSIYRPKVIPHANTRIDDIQHFFIVLKPEKESKFIILILGKKVLPINKETHFSFVSETISNLKELEEDFEEKHYSTNTQEKRILPKAKSISEGSYIISDHHDHTHLFYSLTNPNLNNSVKKFSIMQNGDFIVYIKNPNIPSLNKQGLAIPQKAHYPNNLQNIFKDYKFIPVNPVNFLDY
ncbi:MAG: hypothetical protein AB8U25_02680 [Rickettsiales endosymbiont of Dermacentor nuttalli]